MKTPDEIKKGLEVCSKDKCVCDECEFGGNVWKWRKLMGDALAYIQQLEETVAKQNEKYKRLLETASILSDAIYEKEE